MTHVTRGPIVGAQLYLQVLGQCASSCCCAGWCGKTHQKDGGRCPRTHRETEPLHVVPHEIAAGGQLGETAAMQLPAAEMVALCDACHNGVLAKGRRSARLAAARTARNAPGLFEPATP